MSVAQLDNEIFEAMYTKMMAYNRNGSRPGINYCPELNYITKDEIRELLMLWCNLNEDSFDYKYGETPWNERMSSFLKLNPTADPCQTIQFYKWTCALSYNIEPDTIKHNRQLTEREEWALKLLDVIQYQVANSIISATPGYDDLSWCTVKRLTDED